MSPIPSNLAQRLLIQVLILSTLSACLSACGQSNLLSQGIGENAYVAGETEKRLESSAHYFNNMCRRARLDRVVGPDGQQRCTVSIYDGNAWELIILAALNDIDERCGVYLSKIDDARRDKAFFTRALGNVTATTNTILPLTDPGQTALEVVGIVFGYSQASLENYYSRLILETEKGVVERIVTRLQNAYRQRLEQKLAALRSGPEKLDGISGAYYAVRGYLRLCLPATIEAEIGSLLESVKYVDTGRSTIPKESPVLASIDVIPTVRADASGPGGHPQRPIPQKPPPSNRELRTKLCIKSSDADLFGDPEATAAIREFRAAVDDVANIAPLTAEEKRQIRASPFVCDGNPYRSVFEIFAFPQDRFSVLNGKLLSAMRRETPNQVINIKNMNGLEAPTREAISVLRKKFNQDDMRNYVDWNFYCRIINVDPKGCR